MSRRWVDLPLRAKSLAVIAIPLIPLLASAALYAESAKRASVAQASVAETLEIKAEIATVLAALVDSEVGVRGFLLTRADESLQVYQNAIDVLGPALKRLYVHSHIAQNPTQRAHLRTVIELAATRPLSRLLNHARAAGSKTPVPMELLAESRVTMSALRTKFAEMQQVEDGLLADQTAAAANAERRQWSVSLLSTAFGLLGGVLAAVAFTSGVVARIGRLGENAARLSRGDALLPMPPAEDEVGQLSRRLDEAGTLLTRRVRDVEEAREELDRFFSMSLDLLCIVGPDGRFTRINPAWHDVLGWTEAELMAAPYLDFVHPDDEASTIDAATQLTQGGTVMNFENRYRCKDGSYRWLNWRATPMPQRNMVYATARDVTDQKRAAQELEARAAALASANEELEAFSYSVSHDLRAPLRHITGFAALLERHVGGRLDDEAQRYIRTIETAAKKMGQLIDDLLAFSRVGRTALTKRRVPLDDIVREAQRETAVAANGRSVAWTLGPLPDVDADPALLRLVFVNLLSNAVKYTAARAEPQIEVGMSGSSNGETVVFVRDNGVGFDMKYSHKLFGVFQRLHSASEFEGTGIGLANVRRIINRHGGRTWAEGAVDHGATFYVALPHEGAS